MSNFDWIRRRYGVPAKRGARVEVEAPHGQQGRAQGRITWATGYIWVRIDGSTLPAVPYHPTWKVAYLPAAKGAANA